MRRFLFILVLAVLAFLPVYSFAQPANDDCESAEVIDDPEDFCGTYDTDMFTYQNSNGNCSPELTSANQWYSFVASGMNLSISVDVVGSGIPSISLFTYDDPADPCSNLVGVDIPCTTTGEVDITGLTIGEEYFIVINVTNELGEDAEDTYTLCIENTNGPPYGDPCAPLDIDPSGCQDATNIGAPFTTNYPPGCDFGDNLVFFTTTLTGNNNALTVDLSSIGPEPMGDNYQVVVAQFQNGCDQPFTPLGSICGAGENPLEVPGLIAGEEYVIIVGSDDDSEGDFNLCLFQEGPDPCVTNDLCDIATPLFPITGDGNVCDDGCNINASPTNINGGGCFDLTNQTVWYSVTTDGDALGLNVSLSTADLTFPAIAIFSGSCDALVGVDCNSSQSGSVFIIDADVTGNTTYYIAVTDLDGTNGNFELCVSTNFGLAVCNVDNQVYENWSSNDDTPVGGPYCPGEEVEICYIVNGFDVANSNCQWFQAIIPSFNDGWDPISFGADGEPVQVSQPITTQFQGTWSWYPEGTVHYNTSNTILSTTMGDHGLKFCSVVEPDCPGTGLSNPGGCSDTGDELPGGWFAVTPQGDQLCPFGDANNEPDHVYGDGAGCGGTVGGWEVCVILTARMFPDCQTEPTFTNCGVNFMTFADGETGDWVTNECNGEFPTYFNASVQCNDIPEIMAENQEICSGQETSIELTSNVDPLDYTWTVSAPPPITGESDGMGNFIGQTLFNSADIPLTVIYNVTATRLGCPAELEVEVIVYPDLQVETESDEGCAGATFDVGAYVTVLNGSGDFTWEWNNGVQGQSNPVMPTVTTQYTVTITDNETGCEAVEEVVLEISDLFEVQIEGVTSFCDAEAPQTISANANGGTGDFIDYSWQVPGGGIISTGASNELSVDVPGNYAVTVTDSRGCPGVATFMIDIFESPNSGLISNPPDAAVCPGGDPVLILASPFYTSQPPALPIEFEWETPPDFPELIGNENQFNTTTPGTYTLTITDANGCMTVDSIEIGSVPAPDAFSDTLTVCYTDSLAEFNLSARDTVINGGTELEVLWFEDAATDVEISDPESYMSRPDTVYAQVQDDLCASLPVPVYLTFLEEIPTRPASDTACDEGSGTGTFDLATLDTIVNMGTNNPVTWYEDIDLNNEITDPSNYTGSVSTVYALVSSDGCLSDPVPVTLVTEILVDAQSASIEECEQADGSGTYDLTSVDETVNGGTGLQVDWYEDVDRVNPITDPANYSTNASQVFAQVVDGNCVSEVVPVELSTVIGVSNNEPTAEACDPGTGVGTFNLTSLEEAVNSDPNATFEWFEDPAGMNPVADPTSYSSGMGQVFVRTTIDGCISEITAVNLEVVVNLDAFPATVDACDPGDGIGSFDLTTANNTINGSTGLSVEFYEDMGLTTVIADPTNYTSGPGTIYAIVIDGDCVSLPVEVSLTVTITVESFPASITACDEGNDTGTFDLTSLNGTVDGGNGFEVLWYEDMGLTVDIADPTAYVSSDGTVYALVRDGDCVSLPAEVTLNVEIQVNASPTEMTVCDEGDDTGTFDLTTLDAIVSGGGTGIVNWYTDQGLTSPVPEPTLYTSSDGVVYAQVVENGRCISDVVEVSLNVEIQLFANATDAETCDEGGGQGTFDLTEVDDIVAGGPYTVNWFEDASGNTPIGDPTSFGGANGGVVYAMITDGRCISELVPINLVVENDLPAFEAVVVSCDDGTGQGIFNLTNADGDVSGGLGFEVEWFEDAGATSPIPDPTSYLSGAGTVYAVTIDGACRSLPVEVTLQLIVDVLAFPGAEELCDEGDGTATFNLDDLASDVNDGSGLTVIWYEDMGLMQEITNTTDYVSSGQTLYAVVREGTCESEPVTYELFVNTIESFDVELSACDEGAGEGTFDLTSVNDVVNGGTGFTVEWYEDALLTMQINNPDAYMSGAGTIYASVTDGICRAPLVVVPLEITTDLPASPASAELCDEGNGEAVFDLTTLENTVNVGTGLQVNWYEDQGLTTPISDVDNYQTSDVTVYAQVVDGPCRSLVVEIDLRVPSNPVADAGEDRILTCTDSLITLDATSSSTGSGYVYNWTSQDGNITSGGNTLQPQVDQPGTYILVVTEQNTGCMSTDEMIVQEDVNRPDVDAGEDKELNCSNLSVTLGGSGTPTGDQYDYIWRRDGQTLPGTDNRMIVVDRPGIYTLTVVDNQTGCLSTDEAEVIDNIDEIGNIDVLVDQPACFGEANGCILVEQIEGGDEPYTYSLDGVQFNPNNEICGLGPGDYTVFVRDVNGCEGEIAINIPEPEELFLDIGGSILLEYGDTATITATFNIPPEEVESIIWEPDVIQGPDPYTVYFHTLEQQVVSATLVAEDGCTAQDIVNIFVSRTIDVYAPNAFTPNGDQYNSFFTIYGDEEEVLGIDVLQVYSRWGERVFERFDIPINDESYGWDGSFRGDDMPPGVYAFYAEVTLFDGSKEFLKGDLTLIRQQ